MKILTEKEKLPEVKKRIRHILANIVETEIKSDCVIYNDGHSIHFTIKSPDGILSGFVTKRVTRVT